MGTSISVHTLNTLKRQILLSVPEASDLLIVQSVLWIRIRSDPELFVGSGLGSGINHFGSGSGMNLITNFSVKK
jgi:hypothetical protein